MAETVRVTVAPGGCVKLATHPSGIAALGPLSLFAGASVIVPAAEVDQLYQRGDILHPATGQAKPRQAGPDGPTIRINGSPPMPVSDPGWNGVLDKAMRDAARAHQEAQEPRLVEPPPSNRWPQPIPAVWSEDRPVPNDGSRIDARGREY